MAYNKYGAKKVKTAEGVFDSQTEYRRWCELKLLQRAGKISDLRRQVPYELIPKQVEIIPRYSDKTGKRLKDGYRILEQKCEYIADFVYTEGGKEIVEDCKGKKTREYLLKRKLMLYIHHIRIRET